MFKKKEKKKIEGSKGVAEPESAKPAAATAAYDSIVAALSDILYVLDVDGNVVKWNKVAEEVSGYSPEELSNKPALEFFPEEDRAAIMEGIAKTFKEGRAVAEGRFLTKDGRLIPYSWTGALLKDAKGEIIGMTGIGRDISELKRAEEARVAAFKKAAETIEAMPIGVGIMDLEGKLLQVNETAAKMWRISKSEAIGRPATEFIAEEDVPRAFEAIQECIGKGYYRDFECTAVRKDGSRFPLIVDGTLMRDREGNPISILLAYRDITELKRLQEKEKVAAAEKARAEEAEKYSKELEAKVKELEKFHDLTVGRELKMKKMEEEMEELKKKLKEKGG